MFVVVYGCDFMCLWLWMDVVGFVICFCLWMHVVGVVVVCVYGWMWLDLWLYVVVDECSWSCGCMYM